MKLPKFGSEVAQNANIIEVININDEDVKKVVDYINKSKTDVINQNQKMQIFNVEELEKEIDKTVEIIYSFLKKYFQN
ncbi:MAG: hypothetical protein V8R82_01645 [Clostridia bacterium]